VVGLQYYVNGTAHGQKYAMTTSIDYALAATTQQLQRVSDSPRLDAELLMMVVLDVQRSYLFAHPERELNSQEIARFTALVRRRLDYEPIAYLTGEKEFWSLRLRVTDATLVPRPETELLVEEALVLIPKNVAMKVLDFGTGSGAIAIAIACERPSCIITASDISGPALAIADENAKRHKCRNITLVQGDWLDAVAGKTFDIIVSNPPYVAAGDPAMNLLPLEPRDALVAGNDGLDAIRTIAKKAKNHLCKDGWIFIEHGVDQEKAVADILTAANWQEVRCYRDAAARARVSRAVLR
jgi:release factor glutamine methyltransferase